MHWARRVAERFPDGQLYLNLNGFSPSPPMRPIEALATMLRSIGVAPEKVPVEESEAAALFRSQMAGRRMLMLLDNAHSAEQVRPLLPGGSGTLVLVTSRNSLGGLVAREGARRLPLDVLTPEEAVSLLTQLLGPSRVAASPSAVADLARACAYLPLALRVAAASLLDRPHRSVASHVTALLERGALDALTIEDDPSSAVRAAFDQSYGDIPVDVARTFRLLGLIPGPDFTVDAVAALADLSHALADRHLSRLATAHLVTQIGPDRYTFHDLLRAYAAEHAAADPAEATSGTKRLYDWYLSHVYAAADLLFSGYVRLPMPDTVTPTVPWFDSPKVALSWLDAEGHNLIFAVDNAAARRPLEFAWYLAGGLRGYFTRRRHTESWLKSAHAALAAARLHNDDRAVASAELTVAQTYQATGNYELVHAHLNRAITASRRAGWVEMEAACIGNMSGVYYEIGTMAQAEACVRRSLELKRANGWSRSEAVALGNIALIISRAGRLREAVTTSLEAIASSKSAGLMYVQSASLADLGDILGQLGELDDALARYADAIAMTMDIGDRLGEALALAGVVEVHLACGSIGLAKQSLWRAKNIAAELLDHKLDTTIRIMSAAFAVAQGDQHLGLKQYAQAAELAHGFSGARFPKALAALGLADTLHALQDLESASAHASHALELSRAAGFRVIEGRALTSLARAALASGDSVRARHLADSAMACHHETGYSRGIEDTDAIISDVRTDASEPDSLGF